MRKLLQLPGAPAVVYLHWWSPTTNQGSRSFWNHTVEPESGTLAAYYSLPTLTLRNVWYPRWAANERGFLSRDVMCSINHPNYLGHQCARPGAAPYRLGLGFQPSCRVSVSQRLLACARFRMAWEGGVGKPRVPVMSMERSEQSAAAQLRRCAAPNERVAGRAQVLRGPHHRAAAGPPGGSRAGARARGRAGRPGRAARADAAGQPRGQRRPGVPARESLRAAAVPGNASARPSHARAVDPQLYSKGVSRDWRRHQVRKERCMRPSYTCPVGQCVYSRLLQ